jgi:hypothetical protein
MLSSSESLWSGLPTWSRLEPEQQRQLVGALQRAYAGQIDEIREARDRRLAGILRGLEQARQG